MLEEPESDYTKEPVADEIKLGESEDEEDTRDDCGALSTDDEEFVIGKKRPISNKGRPRGKKIHHTGTFPEVHVPVRDILHYLVLCNYRSVLAL